MASNPGHAIILIGEYSAVALHAFPGREARGPHE